MTSALPRAQHLDSEAIVVGSSPEMVRVAKVIELLPSKPRTPVLIVGESGVGKRHVAAALHRATFPSGAFVELEYSRASAQLAQLFSDPEKAETDPLSSGTTLYIHELTEAPTEVQARLLQLFQHMTEGPNTVRLVASSSRDLGKAARDGFLRHELAYRFPMVLPLPPLRERSSDIPALVARFAQTTAQRFGGSVVTFTAAALERLLDYDWPGNVGELYNLVERSTLFSDRTQVDVDDLPPLSRRQSGFDFRLPPNGISLSDLERDVLVQALGITDHNQTHAAALLGLTRDQMRYRMAKFGIPSRDSSAPPAPPRHDRSELRSRKQSLNSSG